MKVGTDAVILGAWTSISHAERALDIGTGTGLLALMLAQRNLKVTIDAIEIEKNSAQQAASNFSLSKFSSRLKSHDISFSEFLGIQHSQPYDLIICNPPYFSASLRAPVKERSLARHDDSLSLEELFKGVASLLHSNGRFSLILPAGAYDRSKRIAEKYALYPARILHVKPIPDKEPIRICMEYSFEPGTTEEKTLLIEEGGRHIYSKDYIKLTNDFYLDL